MRTKSVRLVTVSTVCGKAPLLILMLGLALAAAFAGCESACDGPNTCPVIVPPRSEPVPDGRILLERTDPQQIDSQAVGRRGSETDPETASR